MSQNVRKTKFKKVIPNFAHPLVIKMIELTYRISLQTCYSVLFEQEKISLSEELTAGAEKSFRFLKDFAKNKIIYGVNTGFGPMAQYRINEADQQQLQYNLIRSHAAGTGEKLTPRYAKAAMLARLHTLSLGYSGIHPAVLDLMKECINRDILPVIYTHGGVGASGDLVQLAHLALSLIGEGEVYYQGIIQPAAAVLEKENLQPVTIHLREGLALINGTSVMTGIGIVNVIYARRLFDWTIQCAAWINEIVQAYDDHFSEPLNNAKKHPGQQLVAATIRHILADSRSVRKREDRWYNQKVEESVFKDKLQEYYSIRCVPQILGPVLETLDNAVNILIEEVNSANDNPIIDISSQNVYHGGNFHGDYVSFEMDKLRIGITKLSMLLERQLNYLLNPSLNEILPAFINLGQLGLNFGMQGAQFTATSTTAENQTLAAPIYTHSIPSNKDNQDMVSMGTNAALLTKKVIDNSFEILSVHLLALAQATDALDSAGRLSSGSRKAYQHIRDILPAFREDLVLAPFLEKIQAFVKENDILPTPKQHS